MQLTIQRAARRSLARMPAAAAEAVLSAMERIAADPFARHPNAKPLIGTSGGYRLRQGDWRALYRIDRQKQEVVLEDVLHRKDAYR
jgi:mRNA interferase RelE/StbE